MACTAFSALIAREIFILSRSPKFAFLLECLPHGCNIIWNWFLLHGFNIFDSKLGTFLET